MTAPPARVALVLVLMLVLPPGGAAAGEDRPEAGGRVTAAEGALVLTEELQLSVARAFLSMGEPYRAITEFKRFLILFPGSPLAGEARIGVAEAYARGGEHADAARAFAAAREMAPGDARAAEAWLLEGVSWWRAGEAARGREALEGLRAAHPGSPETARAAEALALMAVDRGDYAGAAGLLAELGRDAAGRSDREGEARVQRGARVLEEAGGSRERSPAVAGWLSAVVPGSGYLVVGRGGDAATALAVNGLLVAGAVVAWRDGNHPLAALAAGVWIPFYAGAIRGSANAVRRWNLGLRAGVRSRLAAELGVSF